MTREKFSTIDLICMSEVNPNVKIWERKCPQCQRDLRYKNYFSYYQSTKRQSVCRKCDAERRHLEAKARWFRNCPKCGLHIEYNSGSNRNKAIAENRLCPRCSHPHQWDNPDVNSPDRDGAVRKETKSWRQKRNYDERRRAGVCFRCVNPAETGKTQCKVCLE